MALAGLWDQSHEGKPDNVATRAMITTTPNVLIVGMGHPRMPVIVKERDYTRWLDPKIQDQDRAALDDIMVPYPSDLMEGWPVGTTVNNHSSMTIR
jgi:putative SOS response-associated peptidase YedK